MGLFSRSRSAKRLAGVPAPGSRAERAEAEQALIDWVQAHRGVEIYVEPRTAVTGTTMLLVAHDGEFTRRRVQSPAAAVAFARTHTLPIYEAAVVGYPQRMRDYSSRQTALRKRAAVDGTTD